MKMGASFTTLLVVGIGISALALGANGAYAETDPLDAGCAAYLLKPVFASTTQPDRDQSIAYLFREMSKLDEAATTVAELNVMITDLILVRDVFQDHIDRIKPVREQLEAEYRAATTYLTRQLPFLSRRARALRARLNTVQTEEESYNHGLNRARYALGVANHHIDRIEAQALLDRFRVTTHYRTTVATVYNPVIQSYETKYGYQAGVAGVFNPVTKLVEWRYEHSLGIAGVFNPLTGLIEWKLGRHGEGIAGVFNPATGQVEWKSEYNHGVAGVYNPLTSKIEWKSVRRSGVIGFWDDADQIVRFFEKHKSGVSAMPAGGVLLSGSGLWAADLDD